MSPDIDPLIDAVEAVLLPALNRQERRPLLLGICGAQGSGKSTLAASLVARCQARGVATAVLSIDDLYLTRQERDRLARDVHPLLKTRGVPGTHDVKLGLKVIAEMETGRPVALPRFDKSRDDRFPEQCWPNAPTGTQLLILEGWCVGALPQAESVLWDPVNSLEAEEDPQAVWRHYANRALAEDYPRLFTRIDLQVLLAAPDWKVVRGWRKQQEDALRACTTDVSTAIMSDAELDRFIQHYERLTRHILEEMPQRADLTVELAGDRAINRLSIKNDVIGTPASWRDG